MESSIDISRRDIMKAGGALAITPVLSASVLADTDSGEVELTYSCSIPSGSEFGIDVEIREWIEQMATDYHFSESQSLSDGSGTIQYTDLEGATDNSCGYSLFISMEGDGSATPILNSLSIVLPDRTVPDVADWTDHFRDEDFDGWESTDENHSGTDGMSISTDSPEGDSSFLIENYDTQVSPVEWFEGPNLDLTDEFTITGLIKPHHLDAVSSIRIGIVQDRDVEGSNIYLNFDASAGEVFLATYATESPEEVDTIPYDYNDTWTRFTIESDEESQEIRAKVWEHGTTEPAVAQLVRNYQPTSGRFSLDVGGTVTGNDRRNLYVDWVEISGEPFIPGPHEDLYLDARNFVVLDDSIPYSVQYNDPSDGWTNISDSVQNISVNDDTIVQLDETEHTITGVGRGETIIELSHEGITAGHRITSATVTIEDLDILPGFRRVQAIVSDRGFQAIGIATIGAAVISGFTRSGWAGIALGTMILIVAWAAGGAPAGIAISGVLFVVLAAMLRLEMQT